MEEAVGVHSWWKRKEDMAISDRERCALLAVIET